MNLPDGLGVTTQIYIAMGGKGGKTHRTAMGRGVALLLTGIEETGSLLGAAKGLGMAYSKAWKLVGAVEEELGVQLIIRDGARGSALTEEGTALLALYRKVEEVARKASDEAFAQGLEEIRLR